LLIFPPRPESIAPQYRTAGRRGSNLGRAMIPHLQAIPE
jgi:hypothetical protein